MTTEEALKIDPARYSVHGDVATALRVLADALREAQAQTVQMREALKGALRRAAEHFDGCLHCGEGEIVNGTTTPEHRAACWYYRAERLVDGALPAPAARTYEDGVRECARIALRFGNDHPGASEAQRAYDFIGREIRALLSPAPAVAPVDDRCKSLYPPTQGPRCGRPAGHDGAHDSGDGTGGPSVAWSDAVAPVAAPTGIPVKAGEVVRIGFSPDGKKASFFAADGKAMGTVPVTAMPIVLPDGLPGWRLRSGGEEAAYTDKDDAPHERTDQPVAAPVPRIQGASSSSLEIVERFDPPNTAWIREWLTDRPSKERDIYGEPITQLCDAVDLLARSVAAPVAAPNPRVIVAPPIDFSEEDAPKPVAFDAEAALVAAREAARTGLDRNPTVEARQIAHLLRRMLSDALAAGRGAR